MTTTPKTKRFPSLCLLGLVPLALVLAAGCGSRADNQGADGPHAATPAEQQAGQQAAQRAAQQAAALQAARQGHPSGQ